MIEHKCLSCGFSGMVEVIDEREPSPDGNGFFGKQYVVCHECDYTVLVNPFLKPDKVKVLEEIA